MLQWSLSNWFHRYVWRMSRQITFGVFLNLLLIFCAAKALGLSFIPPYLGQNYTNFKQGVNFAVASATAVDGLFFAENNVRLDTNFSLGVQVQWFKQLLPSLCGSRQSKWIPFRNCTHSSSMIYLFVPLSTDRLRGYAQEFIDSYGGNWREWH